MLMQLQPDQSHGFSFLPGAYGPHHLYYHHFGTTVLEGLYSAVRGRSILGSWTSAFRGSRKFAPHTCGWHHADAGQASSEEEQEQMSMFPTRILLATDGSKEAELAGQT